MNEHSSCALDPPSNFSVETTLSRALLKLSFGDRNKIEEEIHGVGCSAVKETPELIRRALHEFDSQLNDRKENDPGLTVLRNVIRISNNDDSGVPPTKLDGCYLNDPGVRIRFLRKEYFVVDQAVEKFILFLEFMTEFFGDFIADRPVLLSDFTSEEMKALKKSRTQFMPYKDRSGRRIFVSLGSVNNHLNNTRLKLKIVMYQHWVVSKDVETQQKGVVRHSYAFDEGPGLTWEKDFRPNFTEKDRVGSMKLLRCIPVRVAANHVYFTDTPFFRLLAIFYLFNTGPERRTHTKIVFGEQTEILYKMASFGVPVDVLPITASGAIKFSNHCLWLDVIKKIELGLCDGDVVECPLSRDVVFRTGTYAKNNPGNIFFRELIQSYKQAHLGGDNKEKYKITKVIYDTIVKGRNGRFLEWNNKGKTWKVVQNPEMARQKIAKTFRNNAHTQRKRESPAKKLDQTFDTATSIVDKENYAEAHSTGSALQEYYSTVHPSKRQKTLNCDCFTISTGVSKDNACFGRNFFETQR